MKLFSLLMAGLAISSLNSIAYANEGKPLVHLAQAHSQPPAIQLSVIQKVGSSTRPLNSLQLSRSAKDLSLCWQVVNIPVASAMNIEETFIAPKRSVMVDTHSQVISSSDGRTHRILSTQHSSNGIAEKCWNFDKTDPTGKYQLNVKVNDVEFKDLSFEIVK